MAQPIAGTNGLVKVVGTPDVTLGEVKEWDLTVSRDLYDASVLGDTWAENVVGLGHWTGTLSGFFSVSTDTGQTLLQNALFNQSDLYVELMTETDKYEGLIRVTQIDIKNPVDGITTFDVSFTGSGPVLFS